MPNEHASAAVAALGQLQTKLNGMAAGATRDQLQAEIETLRSCLDLMGVTARRGFEVPHAA